MRWLISGVHALSSVLRVGNVHLVDYLAQQGEEILYLTAPISPLHYLMRGGDARFRERRGLRGNAPTRQGENILEYTPMTLLPVLRQWPFNTGFALGHTLPWAVPRLRGVLEAAGFSKPDVLVTTNLQYAHLDRLVDARRHVYWCKDDIRAFSHAPKSLARAEEALLERVDLTIATSAYLADRLRERGAGRVECVRNGADVERFARGDAADAPPTVSRWPEPRVIYAGILNERLAVDWIAGAAARLPRVHFVLVGPVATDLGALSSLENVHLTGALPPADLPAAYAACQAAIIPFRRSPLVESTCPIKLYEYLAAGLPVLATRWEELERMDAPVRLLDTADAFAEALETLLAQPQSAEATADHKAWAASHSWEARFQEFTALIKGLDTRRPGRG